MNTKSDSCFVCKLITQKGSEFGINKERTMNNILGLTCFFHYHLNARPLAWAGHVLLCMFQICYMEHYNKNKLRIKLQHKHLKFHFKLLSQIIDRLKISLSP